MATIYNLKNWQLDKAVSNTKRFADVQIYFQYPATELLIHLKPKQRVRFIDQDQCEKLKALLALDVFESYVVNGSKKRPLSLNAKVKYNLLKKLAQVDFISRIFINSIDYAVLKNPDTSPSQKYYCVKMTVVIEVEGLSPKKQDIEKRFVLIRATSHDDAYDKLEKRQDEYVPPFLNPYGRFVRWRIESYDDCFVTDIESPADLDDPAGVEVYSKLSKRRNTAKTPWDGKF